MIRNRLALALTGLSAAALTTFAALAMVEQNRRPVDVTVLWLAGALHLGLVLTWIFIPRLPKWIVAGWGLILFATGIGVIITAPVPAGATGTFPWALLGLIVVGIVTMIMSVVHGSERATI
jgi:hypothetical protein